MSGTFKGLLLAFIPILLLLLRTFGVTDVTQEGLEQTLLKTADAISVLVGVGGLLFAAYRRYQRGDITPLGQKVADVSIVVTPKAPGTSTPAQTEVIRAPEPPPVVVPIVPKEGS